MTPNYVTIIITKFHTIYSGGFKRGGGGVWGLQPPAPPRRISQAHILTYAFPRLVNVTIWLLIEWFIIDLCDESKRKYKLISLY